MTVSMDSGSTTLASVVDEATDNDSRFISACLVIGKHIACADGVVTDTEVDAISGSISDVLHLGDRGFIEELLRSALTAKGDSDERDLDLLMKLVDRFHSPELLHLFAFACHVSAADLSALEDELPLLNRLASLFGVETSFRDYLLGIYCGVASDLLWSRSTGEELARQLHPDRLAEFGAVVHEVALDHARKVQVRLRELDAEVEIPEEVSGADAEEQGPSILREAIQNSPARLKILDVIDRLEACDGRIYDSQHRTAVTRILNKAHDDDFRIAVVGAFSSGKSTLLNALCAVESKEIFPTSIIPCTGAVSILRYGATPAYFKRIRSADGIQEQPLSGPEDFRSLVQLPEDIERAEHFASTDLESLIVEQPIDLLEGGVEVIDSPGLNENLQRTELTERYLRYSDAVIYVMKVDQMASEQDRAQVERLVEEIGREHLFFVINLFDLVAGNAEEESRLMARAESFFKRVYPEESEAAFAERVHFLSAKEILEGRARGETDSRFVEDFDEFQLRLGEYLANAKGIERWRGKATELMRVVEDLHGRAGSLLASISDFSAIEAKRKAQEAQREEIEKRERNIKRALKNAEYSIDTVGEETLSAITASFEDFRGAFFERLEERSHSWETEANPIWGKKQILQDYTEQMQTDCKLLIQEWRDDQVGPLIVERFQSLTARLDQDFESIQRDMNVLRAMSDESFSPPDQEEDSNAFLAFVRAAGGFAAGGPLGALVGATMDWEDVAINFAANFAVGFGLAMMGMASTGVLLPAVAAVGAAQALYGASQAKEKTRKRLLEGIEEHIPEQLDAIAEAIDAAVREQFDELRESVRDIVESQLAEAAEHRKEKELLLRSIEEDRVQQEAEVKLLEQQAARLEGLAEELEPFAAITISEVRSEMGYHDTEGPTKTQEETVSVADVDLEGALVSDDRTSGRRGGLFIAVGVGVLILVVLLFRFVIGG